VKGHARFPQSFPCPKTEQFGSPRMNTEPKRFVMGKFGLKSAFSLIKYAHLRLTKIGFSRNGGKKHG
jgi:hypothetical protein